MDTLIYGLLCLSAFTTVFLFGWQFGCWMVQRDDIKQATRDCYTDDFHNDYYAGSCCKRDEHHHKPKKKAKKTSKK